MLVSTTVSAVSKWPQCQPYRAGFKQRVKAARAEQPLWLKHCQCSAPGVCPAPWAGLLALAGLSSALSSTQRTRLKLKSELQLPCHIPRWLFTTEPCVTQLWAQVAPCAVPIPIAATPNPIPLAAFPQAAKIFCLRIVAIYHHSLPTSWIPATWFPSHNRNQTGLFSGKELSKEPWMPVLTSTLCQRHLYWDHSYCIMPFALGELIPFCVFIFCYQLDLDLQRHMEIQAKSFLWAHAISSDDYSQQYLPLDKSGFQNWSSLRTMFPSQKLVCFCNTLLLEPLSAHGSLSQACRN